MCNGIFDKTRIKTIYLQINKVNNPCSEYNITYWSECFNLKMYVIITELWKSCQ